MSEARSFVDYYAILRVHPECDHRTLEIAYRNLAKIYHPDHPETADIDMFNAVIEAYRAQGSRQALGL
jgi:curved DNA-binding protein